MSISGVPDAQGVVGEVKQKVEEQQNIVLSFRSTVETVSSEMTETKENLDAASSNTAAVTEYLEGFIEDLSGHGLQTYTAAAAHQMSETLAKELEASSENLTEMNEELEATLSKIEELMTRLQGTYEHVEQLETQLNHILNRDD